jgi:hypothetical protein
LGVLLEQHLLGQLLGALKAIRLFWNLPFVLYVTVRNSLLVFYKLHLRIVLRLLTILLCQRFAVVPVSQPDLSLTDIVGGSHKFCVRVINFRDIVIALTLPSLILLVFLLLTVSSSPCSHWVIIHRTNSTNCRQFEGFSHDGLLISRHKIVGSSPNRPLSLLAIWTII